MTKDLPSFQRYQQEFCAHIRDPLQQPRPKNVPAQRMEVYEEIVFNNLFESISACFPVAQKVLGIRAWLKLTQAFLREHSANTPIFRKIPEEFLSFLSTQTNLAPYLHSLCHYEWVELLVSAMAENINVGEINPSGNLLAEHPALAQAMQLLNYDYAVQKISPRHKPTEKNSTQLLVYRNSEDVVKFVELNPVTYRLIELLQQETMPGEQALTMIANEIKHPQPEKTIQYGLEILEYLRKKGIILGTCGKPSIVINKREPQQSI